MSAIPCVTLIGIILKTWDIKLIANGLQCTKDFPPNFLQSLLAKIFTAKVLYYIYGIQFHLLEIILGLILIMRRQ